jgi:hypothetical protein
VAIQVIIRYGDQNIKWDTLASVITMISGNRLDRSLSTSEEGQGSELPEEYSALKFDEITRIW